MNTLPRWRTKKTIQAQSVSEHMMDVNTDVLREHLVLNALSDPHFDSDAMRDSVLHMYLNECRSGKEKAWYLNTQEAFLTHHPQWRDGFNDVLKARWEQGSKTQRTNQMGDWIALSHLGGEPLSMGLLFREKLRHPRDPRPPTQFVVPFPKGSFYRHAFELLYNEHHSNDEKWNTLLSGMSLGSMTASLWDTYVKNWPDQLEKPIKSASLESHEWTLILQELFKSNNAAPLAVQIVNRLQSGADAKLAVLFDRQNTWQRGFLDELLMAETIYNAMRANTNMRGYLSAKQLVHGLNVNPTHVKTELRTIPTLENMPSLKLVSMSVFSPPYVEQLSSEVRANAVQLFAQDPAAHGPLIAQQFDNITSSSWTATEIKTMLSTPGVQALLVNSIVKGLANTFLDHCAAIFPAMALELNDADFTDEHVFETIAMRHLVPSLSHKEALSLTSMAQSLGIDENENIAMYQSAIEGMSSQNSLPIDGLVEDSNDSAFPA